MQDELFFYGSMSRTELAMLYAPGLKPDNARRKLNLWIRRNEELLARLTKRGYTQRLRHFTTGQVRLIMKYLGEP